ncbi:MAG: hypothetical protein AAFP90_20515, partial [Planctomycetota bacterium]
KTAVLQSTRRTLRAIVNGDNALEPLVDQYVRLVTNHHSAVAAAIIKELRVDPNWAVKQF